jgi:hypothetical protein
VRPAPQAGYTAANRFSDRPLIPGASRLRTRRTPMSMSERIIPPSKTLLTAQMAARWDRAGEGLADLRGRRMGPKGHC